MNSSLNGMFRQGHSRGGAVAAYSSIVLGRGAVKALVLIDPVDEPEQSTLRYISENRKRYECPNISTYI